MKRFLFYCKANLHRIIILIGIFLRLFQYQLNRSLWLDESFLALNIVNRSFSELFRPLDYNQVAPVGFLLIERLNIQLFGNSEYVLRLFPLIAGISSIFLFYSIAKNAIGNEAAIIAVALFAISNTLVYYSSEVKQYSSDVLIALLLYVATAYTHSKQYTFPFMFLFGIAGAIAIWFSNPSIFILAGLGLCLLLTHLIRKEWIRISKLSIAFSLWALSFFFFYIFIISSLRKSGIVSNMQSDWNKSFIPFPISSFLPDFEWYIRKFFEIFQNPVGFTLTGIAALAFLIGCISMYAKNRRWFFLLLLPLVITLLASGFHMYPFSDRLLLFLVPSLLLFITEGLVFIREKTKSTAPIIGIVLLGLLILHPAISASYHVITQRPYSVKPIEDVKTVMQYLKNHKKDGDTIYLYYASEFAFKYYAERYGFNSTEYIVGILSRNDWDGYIKDIDKLRGKKRVWLLFSHVHENSGVNEEKLFIFHLDRFGTKLDHFKSDGASVYLYDLSKEV
jgi:uncharacterized membrane protein